jgi:hypothetical protein
MLGAGAAVLGQFTSSKTQIRLSQAQLVAAAHAETTKAQRSAYADFLRAHIQLEMTWKELLRRKEADAEQAELERLGKRLEETEQDRWQAYAVLRLEAPESVSERAAAIVNTYNGFVEAASGQYGRRGHSVDWNALDGAMQSCTQDIYRFAQETRSARTLGHEFDSVSR